ncbi:MAG: hypothetical protein AMXMBFR59_22710 [Rhodanobacteraceae bacterium]
MLGGPIPGSACRGVRVGFGPGAGSGCVQDGWRSRSRALCRGKPPSLRAVNLNDAKIFRVSCVAPSRAAIQSAVAPAATVAAVSILTGSPRKGRTLDETRPARKLIDFAAVLRVRAWRHTRMDRSSR